MYYCLFNRLLVLQAIGLIFSPVISSNESSKSEPLTRDAQQKTLSDNILIKNPQIQNEIERVKKRVFYELGRDAAPSIKYSESISEELLNELRDLHGEHKTKPKERSSVATVFAFPSKGMNYQRSTYNSFVYILLISVIIIEQFFFILSVILRQESDLRNAYTRVV